MISVEQLRIRFGLPEASMDEVIAAAKKVRCHEFIEALPNGYETVVGEGGATLSGGELEDRIDICRGHLKAVYFKNHIKITYL